MTVNDDKNDQIIGRPIRPSTGAIGLGLKKNSLVHGATLNLSQYDLCKSYSRANIDPYRNHMGAGVC